MCVQDVRIGRRTAYETANKSLDGSGGTLFKGDAKRISLIVALRNPGTSISAGGIDTNSLSVYAHGICIGSVDSFFTTLVLSIAQYGSLLTEEITYTTTTDGGVTPLKADITSVYLDTSLADIESQKGE